MKKSLVGTIALGLIIGAGALSTKAFANEEQFNNQNQTQVYSSNQEFRVLNQETNQFEKIDDSNYDNPNNSNSNYGQGCQRGNRRGCDYGYYGNNNRQQNQDQTNENLNFNIQ